MKIGSYFTPFVGNGGCLLRAPAQLFEQRKYNLFVEEMNSLDFSSSLLSLHKFYDTQFSGFKAFQSGWHLFKWVAIKPNTNTTCFRKALSVSSHSACSAWHFSPCLIYFILKRLSIYFKITLLWKTSMDFKSEYFVRPLRGR